MCPSLSIAGVVRRSFWLYIGGLLSSFLGYLYWLIASSFVTPNVIGSAAAVIAAQGLLAGIFSFGLPTGLQRFIGLCRGKDDYQRLSRYFFSSISFIFLLDILLALLILLTSLTGFSFFKLHIFELRFVAIFMILGSGAWASVFISLFNSLLKTEVTAVAQTISSLSRLLVSISLLYLGFDFLGIMLGFIVAFISMDAILLLYAMKVFNDFKIRPNISLSFLHDPLKAGLASWIPNTLTVAGQSIGVLSVYGFVGGAQAGLYFIAFAIAAIVYNLPASVFGLMFPVLSGMQDGRKRAVSGAIKLSSAITVPISLALALYPSLPLSFLGPKYIEASDMLRILALGSIISPIILGYTSYIYAIGKYIHVALIGLLADGGRLILYALFVQPSGELGVATAYTLGFFIALAAIPLSASKIGYRVNWMEALKVIAIPTGVAAALFFSNLHWLISIPILFICSTITYTRLGIITKSDLLEVSQAFLSRESIAKIHLYAKPVIRLMYGE